LPSFGEQLRQARESQNITLQEIAATTKISSRALQALESERFDQLPGGIFNKGFVRAYARYVGLDEEKMLAAYMAVAKPDAPEVDMQAISSQLAAAQRPRKESRIGGTTVMGVLAVIVALALGAVWFREHRKEALEQAAVTAAPAPPASVLAEPAPGPGAGENAAAGTTGEPLPGAQPGEEMSGTAAAPQTAAGAGPNAALNVPPNVAPNATPNAASAAIPNAHQNASATANPGAAVKAVQDAAAGSGQAAPVEVSLLATQKAWISVRSDGKMIESLTLDPDNPELRSRSYKANQKLKLVVGNAGGVTAVCNGKSEGALGAMGQATTITFTSQGMQKR
jgi:cytoskeleton protein RodZ